MSFQASSRAFGDDRQVYLVNAPGDRDDARKISMQLRGRRRRDRWNRWVADACLV